MNIKRINEITMEIGYHSNRIALHQAAINKLRKEKSLLMARGWDITKNEHQHKGKEK